MTTIDYHIDVPTWLSAIEVGRFTEKPSTSR
jgi:hypothetical protein